MEGSSTRQRRDTPKKKTLVELLCEQQEAVGASDRTFGPYLGVTQAMWSRTKAGERTIGLKLIRGALRVYPQLEGAVLDYLRQR